MTLLLRDLPSTNCSARWEVSVSFSHPALFDWASYQKKDMLQLWGEGWGPVLAGISYQKFYLFIYLLKKIFFNLFVLREEREPKQGRGRREGERIPSRLQTARRELDAGLELTNCKIVPGLKLRGGCLTDSATQAPSPAILKGIIPFKPRVQSCPIIKNRC